MLETIGAPLYAQTHDPDARGRVVGGLRSRMGEEAFEAA